MTFPCIQNVIRKEHDTVAVELLSRLSFHSAFYQVNFGLIMSPGCGVMGLLVAWGHLVLLLVLLDKHTSTDY